MWLNSAYKYLFLRKFKKTVFWPSSAFSGMALFIIYERNETTQYVEISGLLHKVRIQAVWHMLSHHNFTLNIICATKMIELLIKWTIIFCSVKIWCQSWRFAWAVAYYFDREWHRRRKEHGWIKKPAKTCCNEQFDSCRIWYFFQSEIQIFCNHC